MQPSSSDSLRPGSIDLAAAFLLLATVVLHVVAMFPTYATGRGALADGSLAGQSDQATAYAILAGGWAVALAVGLLGPGRARLAAALALGVAAGELGFRLSDLGQPLRYGTNTVGSGFWIMETAWLVGAAGAVTAGLAVRARGRRRDTAHPPLSPVTPAVAEPEPAPTTPEPNPDDTAAMPRDLTAHLPAPSVTEEAPEQRAWVALVGLLAATTAGLWLPAWDEIRISSTIGAFRPFTQTRGNAFSDPWQFIVGTVLVSVALLAVPLIGVRLKDGRIGAALGAGCLIPLAAQLTSAVVLVSHPLSFSQIGVPEAQAARVGLSASFRLTPWYTIDLLAAYGLLAALLIKATLRPHPSAQEPVSDPASADGQANSGGTWPSAPDWRSQPIAWPS